MSKHEHDPIIANFHARLKLIREIVSGESQQHFAEQIGIDMKRWNNFEQGFPIPRDILVLLVKHLKGMSADWILFGWEDHLSGEWQRKVKARKFAERRMAALPEPPKPPKGKGNSHQGKSNSHRRR